MTVFVRLSPSRTEKFRECEARWGFAELPGGVAEPDTEATDFGTKTHACHDDHYTRGKPYDLTTREGWVASAMAAHLPSVLPYRGASELELTYQAEPGLELVGRPDLGYLDFDRHVAHVTDYKTTGSFRYSKLERDALFGHSQAPLYALMLMRHWNTTQAFCRWVYAKRPPLGPGPWPLVEVQLSDHDIGIEEATERVHLRMVPAARKMQDYADAGMTAADAHKLPKNLMQCRSYGRWCPYLSRCQPQKDPHHMNAFLQSLQPADGAAAAPPPAPGPNTGSALINPSGIETGRTSSAAPNTSNPPAADPPPSDAPAVNPPEGAGKAAKGKKKDATTSALDDATLEALAERVVDKLALRLARGVK